jgi:O-antigen ligase
MGEKNLRKNIKAATLNSKGQTTIELILPLVIVLFMLIALALVIPTLSVIKTFALLAGVVIFIASFASTEMALFVLIFSMLLSPEFMVGATAGASMGRGVTLRLDDFLLVIVGFSWLAKMSINKELGLFLKTPLNKPIAFYVIICIVSTLFGAISDRVDLKTGFFFVVKYFEYMIVYFMVVNNLNTKDQLKRYVWAMLITCAIVSLIRAGQIPSGERVSAPFEGAVGEPNTFGGYLVFMISITMGLFLHSISTRDRLIYSGFIFLFTLLLLYTRSRSSYIAGIPAMLTFILLSGKKHWLIPAFLLAGILMPFIAPNVARERVAYTFTQGINQKEAVEVAGVILDTSTSARLKTWAKASKDWARHPIIGYGVTGYGFIDAQYMRVITETGFLGLIFFFILMGTVFRETHDSFKKAKDPFHKGLSMGFIAGFVGLLFHGLGANTFIIVRIMEPFWFMAALVVMIPKLEEDVEI